MSDGEPGRMTNPPRSGPTQSIPFGRGSQHLYDIAVEVNVVDLAGLKRRALELSSSKKLPVSLFAATQVATHPSISSSDDQDMRGRVRCGLPNAC
jgi:hypothetical protein